MGNDALTSGNQNIPMPPKCNPSRDLPICFKLPIKYYHQNQQRGQEKSPSAVQSYSHKLQSKVFLNEKSEKLKS